MACARLDHIDHTAYMSFQCVGFSSSMNVSLRFRCPHLLQVSIKANPFVLFLVCLHLFVCLLSLILSETLQLCTLLAYFPSPVFLCAFLSTKAALPHPYLHQRPVLLWGPQSMMASFRERKWSVRRAFISKWSDVMWDCENHSARGVRCSLSWWGIAAWSLLFIAVRIIKVAQTHFSSFSHLWVKQLVFQHKHMGFFRLVEM